MIKSFGPKTEHLPILAASKKFKRYLQEDSHGQRTFTPKNSPIVSRIVEVWRSWLILDWRLNLPYGLTKDVEEAAHISIILKSLDYTSKDVEKLSLMLPQLRSESHHDGLDDFLTALAAFGKETEYTIWTDKVERGLIIGQFLKRDVRITVNGDLAEVCGMSKGGIIVNGNVSLIHHIKGDLVDVKGSVRKVFRIAGGTIIVRNDAEAVGEKMTGGRIFVGGSVKHAVGVEMTGGEIHLDGDFRNLSKTIRGGKIYHKGELIVDK
jgi:hypothetical protein